MLKRALSIIALLLAACGPGKPVLLYVPASIALDPNGAPRRSANVVSPSKSYWEAMLSLDTGYVKRQPVNETQRAFADALGLVMSGHHDDAALAFDAVRIASIDTVISSASRVLMTAMLQYQDKWKLLAELDSMGRHSVGDNDADKADVESWATAFRKVPEREMNFPERPVVLPLLLSASGAPMIPVTINGKEHAFWIDTGSSLSIVSSSVATECGMSPLISDTLAVATTTGRVPAQAGAIAQLNLGALHVHNTTALIVADSRMLVRVGDGSGTGVPIVSQIEGVIGYDIISRMDIRIDYVNQRVTIMKPEVNPRMPRSGRNLFWVGTPIVRLVTSKGVPLHFNLDTGAQESYSTDALLGKIRVRTLNGERRLVGGLAGLTVVRGRFVDEVHATMGGQPLVLRKLLVFAPQVSSFVSLDGVLGSDVGRGGVVRIDATNGLFLLEAPTPGKGLRIKS
jgi:hypothetical protein